MKTKRFKWMPVEWESLALPLVLVLAGALVLVGADLGLVSLDRAKDLWPAALILVGLVDLLPAGRQGRGAGNE